MKNLLKNINDVYCVDDLTNTYNGVFIDETVKYLKNLRWLGLKIYNETIIKVIFDGERIKFYYDDNKRIDDDLNSELAEIFLGQQSRFIKIFGDDGAILFFRYIQNAKNLADLKHNEFNLYGFGAMINENILSFNESKDLFKRLNLPYLGPKQFTSLNSILLNLKSEAKEIGEESKSTAGYLAMPLYPLYNNKKDRIICKIMKEHVLNFEESTEIVKKGEKFYGGKNVYVLKINNEKLIKNELNINKDLFFKHLETKQYSKNVKENDIVILKFSNDSKKTYKISKVIEEKNKLKISAIS